MSNFTVGETFNYFEIDQNGESDRFIFDGPVDVQKYLNENGDGLVIRTGHAKIVEKLDVHVANFSLGYGVTYNFSADFMGTHPVLPTGRVTYSKQLNDSIKLFASKNIVEDKLVVETVVEPAFSLADSIREQVVNQSVEVTTQVVPKLPVEITVASEADREFQKKFERIAQANKSKEVDVELVGKYSAVEEIVPHRDQFKKLADFKELQQLKANALGTQKEIVRDVSKLKDVDKVELGSSIGLTKFDVIELKITRLSDQMSEVESLLKKVLESMLVEY